MIANKKIRSEIEDVVRSQIRSSPILNVVVERGKDWEGEDIISVHVIFDDNIHGFQAGETVGITRLVRDRLTKLGEDSFPVFHYVAKSEAGKLAEAG